MLKNNLLATGFLLIALFLFFFASWGGQKLTEHKAFSSIKECGDIVENDGQIECIFHAIDTSVKEGNLKEAFSIFSSAYKNFKSFSGSGCHRHAHRVGDTVYYNYYIFGDQNLDLIEFPQETTACGYGLFHGFLEHLIQDHPDPEFGMDTCETLNRNLSETMKDIRVICYHGTGHGYTLAHAEHIQKSEWGNVRVFSDVPISKCNSMYRATESEKEDCRQGVFNVIADWAETEDYGFSHNKNDPFELCHPVARENKYACYYEMSQKIIADNDPVEIYNIVSSAPTHELIEISFMVGVAGIMQNTIVDGNGYEYALSRCVLVPKDFIKPCIESIVWGLYEHGPPQYEYKNVIKFCSEPLVAEVKEEDLCFQKAIDRLPRFYEKATIDKICHEFPNPYKDVCLDRNKTRLW